MRLLPILLILGGCAVPTPPSSGGAELSRELAGRVAGPAQQCIRASSDTRSLQALERRSLVYRDGRTLWVNRLSEGCPGFHPTDTLIVEIHGSEYCRNDLVRSLPQASGIPGPACRLGDFVPYRR